jgi:hypothetical protein
MQRFSGTFTLRLRACLAIVAASACLLGLAVPAAQATRIVPWKAVEVLTPAGGGYGQLNSIACPKAGACEAVGSYYIPKPGGSQPMVAVEGRHGWSRAVRIRLPSNAEGEGQNTMLPSIACPSARSCVAVGYYTWGTGFMDGLITTGHGTSWSKGRTPVLPKGVVATDGAAFSGVSCPKTGDCEAVGGYGLSTGSAGLPMAEAMTRGRWQRAVTIRPPANAYARPAAYLSSVSCTAVGQCVAVGHYTDKATAEVAMAAVETRGKWGRAVEVGLPARSAGSPEAEMTSVSCVRAVCEAAGTYTIRSGQSTAFVAAEMRGRWRDAVQITALPTGAQKTAPTVDLFGISCIPNACMAVGAYQNQAGALVPMAVVGLGRTWERAKSTPLPRGAAGGGAQGSQLWAVACDAADLYCTAAGDYAPATGSPQAAMVAAGGM